MRVGGRCEGREKVVGVGGRCGGREKVWKVRGKVWR